MGDDESLISMKTKMPTKCFVVSHINENFADECVVGDKISWHGTEKRKKVLQNVLLIRNAINLINVN